MPEGQGQQRRGEQGDLLEGWHLSRNLKHTYIEVFHIGGGCTAIRVALPGTSMSKQQSPCEADVPVVGVGHKHMDC